MNKTICIDFDGVIYPNFVYHGSYTIIGEPIAGAVESIRKLSLEYRIVINSSRFNDMEAMQAVRDWLLSHGMDYELSEYKPTAHLYLDDRGVQFNGDWNKAIEDINNFKQWQQDEKEKIKRLKKHRNALTLSR